MDELKPDAASPAGAVNIYAVLGMAMQIASTLMGVYAQLQSGQPVVVPQIRAYLGSTHVAIDMTVKEI